MSPRLNDPSGPAAPAVSLVDENLGTGDRAVDFERAELGLRFQVELQANFRAFLHFDGLRGLVLEAALGHPHGDLSEGLDAQLAVLRAAAVLLVVEEHAHVVLAGRDNQGARR